jgi:hypothetical protein
MKIEETIKNFVRSLGCNCPEEVFEQIEYQRVAGERFCNAFIRISIGGKLLVYVADAENVNSIIDLVSNGVAYRNENGFLRFRAVLAAKHPSKVNEAVFDTFLSVKTCDDKTHLHVVPFDEALEILSIRNYDL